MSEPRRLANPLVKSTDEVNNRAITLNDELRAQVSSLQSAIDSTKSAAEADGQQMQAKINQLEFGKQRFCRHDERP